MFFFGINFDIFNEVKIIVVHALNKCHYTMFDSLLILHTITCIVSFTNIKAVDNNWRLLQTSTEKKSESYLYM